MRSLFNRKPLQTIANHHYAIALGSNLGDRLHHLRQAVRLMLERLPQGTLIAAAPVYESAPVDCPDGSGAFYNSVVVIECGASPPAVLMALQGIEHDLGRPDKHSHHAPRTIDLDILCAGSLVLETADLVVPHPRLTERRFVLQPLADICPDLVLPERSESIAGMLARLAPDGPPLRLVNRNWA